MKPSCKGGLLVALVSLPVVVSAQLLPEQRRADFQNLVAMYSKRYAPYGWKAQAFGVNMFQTQPWVDRVRAAKDDLEFFEIEAEYVAQLQDTHSGFQMTSSFRADMGMTVDLYDGKVLIDGINRATLPVAKYPFQIGDEVVTVDGKTVEEWIARIGKYRQWGNPVSTRRVAAGQIAVRSQSTFPRAPEIGDSAVVEIRRASGDVETYTLPWTKTGNAVAKVGPVHSPVANQADRLQSAVERGDYEQALADMHDWSLPANDLALTPIPWTTDANGFPRSYVSGIGSRNPIFLGGLPANFVPRLGRSIVDIHFSGTYQAGGMTIGYLRIPSFAPPNTAQAIAEIASELAFFQQNTQGLVLDIMRNPGGGCYMLDVAARLIPFPFYFFGEQLRVTQGQLNSIQSLQDFARLARAPQWVIDTYQVYIDAMRTAYSQDGALTGPIPACAQFGTGLAPIGFGNLPAAVVYTKPMIVLIDEFSISAADIFPSMLQDNGRGVLVGMRTAGGGGSVSGWQTGFYSESVATNTNTLVVRKNPIVTQDLPTAPYVENIGARPDIPLSYMTRENLLSNGRTFVNRFTDILLDQIRQAAP